MTKALKYTRDDMDRFVMETKAHRDKLVKVGLIDHAGRLTPPPAPAEAKPEPVTHNGYCMKCKSKTDVLTEKVEDTPKGSSHVSGKCSKCGTSVHSFHKKTDGDKLKSALESTRAQTGI